MEPGFFDEVRDAFEGFAAGAGGTLHTFAHSRGLKAWFGDATREHYEAQLIRIGGETRLEVGFHAEYPKAAQNDELVRRLMAREPTWRPELGDEAEVGPFIGRDGWRRISRSGHRRDSRSDRRGDRGGGPPGRLCARARTGSPVDLGSWRMCESSRMTTTARAALRSRRAAREVPRERDKRLRADGNEQYIEVVGRVRPLPRRPLRRADRACDRCTTRSRCVIIGGGFGGLLAGARLREAGIDDIRDHREGRRLRRHLVLEPLPGRGSATSSPTSTCRCSRRSATCRRRSTPGRPRSSPTAGRSAGTSTCTATPASRPRSPEMRWDEPPTRWIVSTNRGDAMRARFVVHGERPAAPPEAARHPRHRDVRGPHVPHQPLGLRLHRRRLRRQPDRPRRQARRHHRHRRHRGAVRAAPRRAARSSCTCSSARRRRSTCATTGPTDPEWAATLQPGWQQRRMENFNNLVSGVFESEDLVNDGWTDIIGKLLIDGCAAAQATSSAEGLAKTMELADFEKMEQIRARVDTIVDDPQHGRGAEAVLPPVLQAPVLPRRVPRTRSTARTSRWSTPRAAASSGSPTRRAIVVDGRRVRARLPDLRDRLRGRHRLHPPRGLRARTAATASR